MMEFKVVTPHGVVYEDTIQKVTIPTQAGEITVLESHAPLVSMVVPGEMNIHKEDHVVNLAVSGGIVEIRRTGEVYIMADSAERSEDIDLDRATQARERAEALMAKQDSLADMDFARLQAKISKETARISVANKYRR